MDNTDYSRCLIVTKEEHPETYSVVILRAMLRRAGAKDIKYATGEFPNVKEHNPTYIADLSVRSPVDVLEHWLSAPDGLIVDVFKPSELWWWFTPSYVHNGGLGVIGYDFLLKKLNDAQVRSGTVGGNDWEYSYFAIHGKAKQIRLFNYRIRGPSG